jgi:hypothetical protein
MFKKLTADARSQEDRERWVLTAVDPPGLASVRESGFPRDGKVCTVRTRHIFAFHGSELPRGVSLS